MAPKEPSLNISHSLIQEAVEDLDPVKTIKDLAASAAEILAESNLSTSWDDIVLMLDSEDISERLKLAAHLIFRAKLILEEMERNPKVNNIVYNTMLMMDAIEVANIKGYLPEEINPNFQSLKSRTSSINSAIKKEKIVHTIKELSIENPNKGITWLRKKASQLLTDEGLRLFDEIFLTQKKRFYNAFLNSDSRDVISFDKVLRKIINEKF